MKLLGSIPANLWLAAIFAAQLVIIVLLLAQPSPPDVSGTWATTLDDVVFHIDDMCRPEG